MTRDAPASRGTNPQSLTVEYRSSIAREAALLERAQRARLTHGGNSAAYRELMESLAKQERRSRTLERDVQNHNGSLPNRNQ